MLHNKKYLLNVYNMGKEGNKLSWVKSRLGCKDKKGFE